MRHILNAFVIRVEKSRAPVRRRGRRVRTDPEPYRYRWIDGSTLPATSGASGWSTATNYTTNATSTTSQSRRSSVDATLASSSASSSQGISRRPTFEESGGATSTAEERQQEGAVITPASCGTFGTTETCRSGSGSRRQRRGTDDDNYSMLTDVASIQLPGDAEWHNLLTQIVGRDSWSVFRELMRTQPDVPLRNVLNSNEVGSGPLLHSVLDNVEEEHLFTTVALAIRRCPSTVYERDEGRGNSCLHMLVQRLNDVANSERFAVATSASQTCLTRLDLAADNKQVNANSAEDPFPPDFLDHCTRPPVIWLLTFRLLYTSGAPLGARNSAGDTVLHRLAKRTWARTSLSATLLTEMVFVDPSLRYMLNQQALYPIHLWAQYPGVHHDPIAAKVLQALLADVNAPWAAAEEQLDEPPPQQVSEDKFVSALSEDTNPPASTTENLEDMPGGSSSSKGSSSCYYPSLAYHCAIRSRPLLKTVSDPAGHDKKTLLHRMALRGMDWPSRVGSSDVSDWPLASFADLILVRAGPRYARGLLNAQDGKGRTALTLACKRGHAEVVRYFLSRMNDDGVFSLDRRKKSAFFYAMRSLAPSAVIATFRRRFVGESLPLYRTGAARRAFADLLLSTCTCLSAAINNLPQQQQSAPTQTGSLDSKSFLSMEILKAVLTGEEPTSAPNALPVRVHSDSEGTEISAHWATSDTANEGSYDSDDDTEDSDDDDDTNSDNDDDDDDDDPDMSENDMGHFPFGFTSDDNEAGDLFDGGW
ncbi:unnamed protein product [Amoebophrya sp. A25]|nr:unnamed protein product [Amoebophrya sp. A25]|eukprot:GSA25T00011359001.1